MRAFAFGRVRQLDRVLAQVLCRAWASGAGPGDERLIVDVDSFVGEVYGYDKQGAAYGYTHQRGYHPIVATRAATGEVLHIRARKGSANTSRGALRFVEELIARVARAGATGAKLLRADSGFWNRKIHGPPPDRGLDLLKFLANAAWTVIAALAHNLLRWSTLIGLPDTTNPSARTLRRRLLTIPAGSPAPPAQ